MITTPKLLRSLYPGVIWNYRDTEKILYLTFDDGPHPEITPKLLDILDENEVKASFFCLGKQAVQFPLLMNSYSEKGHMIGHHSHDHPNGLSLSTESYLENVRKGNTTKSMFFRPPYGKIKPKQLSILKQTNKVIMWDVLSKDYEKGMSIDRCLDNVISNIKPGSIVVFHENEKSKNIVLQVIPELINQLKNDGWEFGLIH